MGSASSGSSTERQQNEDGRWDSGITRQTGIGTPSAQWMGDLLKAQESGGDLPPHPTSQWAAQLPQPPYPKDRFPGESAWIEGDWKLHRISDEQGEVRWEMYDLVRDPREEQDRTSSEKDRFERMRENLKAWLGSVIESLNGGDYGRH